MLRRVSMRDLWCVDKITTATRAGVLTGCLEADARIEAKRERLFSYGRSRADIVVRSAGWWTMEAAATDRHGRMDAFLS
jgi:hypothetical protein